MPPADPLSIFTQHLHTVIHDLIACTIKHGGVALLPRTVDAAPELSCLVVAFAPQAVYFTAAVVKSYIRGIFLSRR